MSVRRVKLKFTKLDLLWKLNMEREASLTQNRSKEKWSKKKISGFLKREFFRNG